MQLDELQYHTETQGGFSVDAADYNAQFKIWTADHSTYYLYDRVDNDVTEVPKVQLQSWIDAGYLEPGDNADLTAQEQQQLQQYQNIDNTSWIKPVFIGGALLMGIYIFTR